jgi:hypothetical protein
MHNVREEDTLQEENVGKRKGEGAFLVMDRIMSSFCSSEALSQGRGTRQAATLPLYLDNSLFRQFPISTHLCSKTKCLSAPIPPLPAYLGHGKPLKPFSVMRKRTTSFKLRSASIFGVLSLLWFCLWFLVLVLALS